MQPRKKERVRAIRRPRAWPIWGLGLALWLLGDVGQVQAQIMPPQMSEPIPAEPVPTMSRQQSPQKRPPPGMCGGSPATTLLPLMLMAGLGLGLFFFIRRMTRLQSPAVGAYPRGVPPGLTPEQALAWEHNADQMFHQSIAQLGSETVEVRVGAVNTLARLAWENPRLHQSACGTLDGFIREGLSKLPEDLAPQELPADIQIAQTTFGRMTGQGVTPGGLKQK